MIATLCNEEFIRLYAFAKGMLQENSSSDGTAPTNTESTLSVPTPDIVQLYSNMKAAIFARYRTVSELLGVVLLREAQNVRLNCMLETSGRDVAMFHYIDHFFSKEKYHKLALHFIINDLEYAKTSVDQRMIKEIQTGIAALDNQNIFDIIDANAGGPYGSEVLSGIQGEYRVLISVVFPGRTFLMFAFRMWNKCFYSGFGSRLEGRCSCSEWCWPRLVQSNDTNQRTCDGTKDGASCETRWQPWHRISF